MIVRELKIERRTVKEEKIENRRKSNIICNKDENAYRSALSEELLEREKEREREKYREREREKQKEREREREREIERTTNNNYN